MPTESGSINRQHPGRICPLLARPPRRAEHVVAGRCEEQLRVSRWILILGAAVTFDAWPPLVPVAVLGSLLLWAGIATFRRCRMRWRRRAGGTW
jgi:hypothetical protein